MTINLDVVIDTPEPSVDMKTGLDSLQGISDATRCIAEAILTERVPEKQHYKGKVRTTLKQSFTGSYGHVFSLDIHDEKLLLKFNEIGAPVFAEVIGYYLSEALYSDTKMLSIAASSIIERLEKISEELESQLRKSSLNKIHQVSLKFNHDLKLRYRSTWENQTIIATFDNFTAQVLLAKPTDEVFQIEANITRLNINTGNGRLLVQGENETVAFGFGSAYQAVNLKAKKLFSKNLDFNNGLEDKDREFLRISVTPIRLHDKTVVKYLVRSIHSD